MISVAIVKELLAAGLAGDGLVAALERIESADNLRTQNIDQQAERRRAKDRERARVRRQSADSADTGFPDKEIPPTPPKEINPSPELRSVSVSARADEPHSVNATAPSRVLEFRDVFWPGWPHKVGKPAALRAFMVARRTSSLEAIIAGRDRYIAAKPPDRSWLNPATFLNQERFNDEPAANPVPAKPELPHDTIFRALAKVVEDRSRLGGEEVGADGSSATARVAASIHRNPYDEPWRTPSAPRPRPRLVEGGRSGDRQADGGISDAGTVRYPDFPADAGVFRGSG